MPRALFAVGLVFLLLLPGVVWVQGRDVPALEEGELGRTPEPVRAALNGRERLGEAASRLRLDDMPETPKAIAGAPAARATAWVARNRGALAGVEAVLEAPRFQLRPEDLLLDDPAEVRRWRALAALLVVRARLEADDGRRAEALVDFERAARLGHRVEAAEGGALLHGLMGLEMRSLALDGLRDFALEAPLSEPEARELVARLDDLRTGTNTWPRVWAGEYRALRAALVDGWGGDLDAAANWALHPNRTLNRFAAHFDHLARESARPCTQMVIPRMRGEDMTFLRKLRIFLAPNGAGEVLFEVGRPDARRVHERRCLVDTKLGAVQATLAVRAHEARHGALPASLDQLVPDLLPAIPRDAFDGQPLRYAPERRMLWSVGADARDAGGRGPGDPLDPAEPRWRL